MKIKIKETIIKVDKNRLHVPSFIKTARKKFGLTQTAMGKLPYIKTSQNNISRWETGECDPPALIILALQEMLRKLP